MALRCLVFSSNKEMVEPVWQVLADLGIEGEYCQSAVDAVEKVTTQMFQIVMTDWDDQPEAAFLLKTARDLKAAQRPLTLAIVSDDGRLPEALKAGANSVLVKPLRPEQVRDTMSTACQLLRAKQQTVAQAAAKPDAPAETPALETMAAAASAGAVSAPASLPSSDPVTVPASVTQAPEKTFRAGEFMQSPSLAPGAQFDTEGVCEVQKSLDQAAMAEMDALTDLEPMAAAVQEAPAEPAPAVEPQAPMTGWAALQARLTRTAPPPAEEAPAKGELLAYGETPSFGAAPEGSAREGGKAFGRPETQPESGAEAALFAHIAGEPAAGSEPAEQPRSKRGRILVAGMLAVASILLVGMPRARLGLRGGVGSAVRAGRNWLNPPPAPVPQALPQHDSFGQSGDEYKLPVATNIPDATTDPSQIRVLPVIDPTAKPDKAAAASAQAAVGDANPAGQNQAAQNPGDPGAGGQAQAAENPIKDPVATVAAGAPGNAAGSMPVSVTPGPLTPVSITPVVTVTAAQDVPPQSRPVAPPVRSAAPPHDNSMASSAGIPSSLKSQMASSAPDASGNKPPEAAMSSIEPVSLPEADVRSLLTQPVDPVYPDSAKASGQRGSVLLQVLIGRDGAVQDAKFLQGSLVFARAAIDAVKQWHFKPYSMNGRAVSVQSVITLKFAPPA